MAWDCVVKGCASESFVEAGCVLDCDYGRAVASSPRPLTCLDIGIDRHFENGA
jgi:hypothetical protein